MPDDLQHDEWTEGRRYLGLEILAKGPPHQDQQRQPRKRGHDTSSTHRLECKHGSHGDVFIHHTPGLDPERVRELTVIRCCEPRLGARVAALPAKMSAHTWVVTNPIREPGRSTPFGERDPVRVVAFSDGVIAIAVTLLVLDIRPPEDTRHLLESLAALWPSYLAYVVTFMLIGQVWANHHVMFDQIRSVARAVLFLNTVLLMDIALMPFAASVLARAFRNGHGERTAVVLHGLTFEVAAILFNIIWWYARHDRRLLSPSIDAAGVKAIGRRFQLALVWIATGTLLGILFPPLGVAVIAAFIPYYWLPIHGEIANAKHRREGRARR